MRKIALFLLMAFLGSMTPAKAQLFKKLKKRAERAAERTIERRVDKETSEKTDEVLDSILEPGKKQKRGGNSGGTSIPEGQNPGNTGDSHQSGSNPNTGNPGNESLTVYSKFDFVPGDKQLFFDDFSNDFVGDFPAKWNTNAGGELVTINDSPNKWLKLQPGFTANYIPDITDLPEEFTLEFDVLADGLDRRTSSQAFLRILIGDNSSFDKPRNFAFAEYSFCQFGAQDVVVENAINGQRDIRSNIQADYRNAISMLHHISIAVNKQRFRLWINEHKYVDVPRLLPGSVSFRSIKFNLRGTDPNKEAIYISNIKVAEGGQDLRRKLLADGRISTNAILFDSGSANLQPQSMGVIRQISQVLQQEPGLQLKIVGHTDSDGIDSANRDLSKRRAEAVKNALARVYNIDSNRLQTEGKGEAQPVADNSTPEGKAQNRRVEFIKL